MNLGELTKPATVLIEKISEAIGGIFRPYQIRRIAEAEAQASSIKAISQIEITELQRRAMYRFFSEEAKKQQNIESITARALPELAEAATPEKLEDDWITNFFDKCRLISDEEMQILWSKVLAGEASAPGRYSKRTVSILSSLDKSDAALFTGLCSFNWVVGEFVPIVFDAQDNIYTEAGINFVALKHLDEIGLISFESFTGFQQTKLPQKIGISYYDERVEISFPKQSDNCLDLGKVLFSKAGQQLAGVCGSASAPGFLEYTIGKWKSEGLQVIHLHHNTGAVR
ncbi:MAG: DUF2806 domain-containing protein [Bryobacteraceae bacterium]